MAIGSAIKRGSLICVYDQHGHTLFSKAKGSGAKDALLGFTGSTVTVRFGSIICTDRERGETVFAKAAWGAVHTVQHPVRVVTLDRVRSTSAGRLLLPISKISLLCDTRQRIPAMLVNKSA